MEAEHYKTVIKEAIKSEIEAKEFYLKISERIKDASLKELFEGFSREEGHHEKILTALLEKGKIKTTTFKGTQDFKLSETIDMPEVSENMDLKSAISLAMKNEEIAMQKYQQLARNADDPELKSVFNGLAAMEKDHKFKMETSFVNIAYPEVW